MSRTIRLVMLVSAASVLGACAQSPTGPTNLAQPSASTQRPVPTKANPDGVCDWINPWLC
jgi:hypothetical protein